MSPAVARLKKSSNIDPIYKISILFVVFDDKFINLTLGKFQNDFICDKIEWCKKKLISCFLLFSLDVAQASVPTVCNELCLKEPLFWKTISLFHLAAT